MNNESEKVLLTDENYNSAHGLEQLHKIKFKGEEIKEWQIGVSENDKAIV